MEQIILVTRPHYDDGTAYLSYYAQEILKNAEKLNKSKKDFYGKNANISEVSKFIKKKNPKLIFINGHGDKDSLFGQDGEILFSIHKNLGLLKNRLIYARACNAGLNFGKEVVAKNKGCFIGYTLPFSFWIDETHSATPAKDNTARLFLEPSNEVVNCLLKGGNAKYSDLKSKELMIKNMREVAKMNEEKEPGAMGLLNILWNNYSGQIILGNQELCF